MIELIKFIADIELLSGVTPRFNIYIRIRKKLHKSQIIILNYS